MEKTKIFSLWLTLLFVQWNNSPVDSADTSEAKLTGAVQKTDDRIIVLEKDQDSKSEWSVKVKNPLSESDLDRLFLYFFTRTDPKAKFELIFGSKLCGILQTIKENKNFLPKQVTDMIFPRQNGSCDFMRSVRAIRATAQVNTNYADNFGFIPKTTPFEMEVRLLTYLQSFYFEDKYIFKMNFNIGGDITKK